MTKKKEAKTEEPRELRPDEREPDFKWNGQPVWRCKLGCNDHYERFVLQEVLDHEAAQHPTNLRVSNILGEDGKPLIIAAE